jgi:hypothetical protein
MLFGRKNMKQVNQNGNEEKKCERKKKRKDKEKLKFKKNTFSKRAKLKTK